MAYVKDGSIHECKLPSKLSNINAAQYVINSCYRLGITGDNGKRGALMEISNRLQSFMILKRSMLILTVFVTIVVDSTTHGPDREITA